MNAPLISKLLAPQPQTVELSIDGRTVQARADETIWAVAQREGTTIPHLCHKEGLEPAGNCRACMVEVEGERTLAASCCRSVAAGMKVQTQSDRALAARKMVVELLMSDAGATHQRVHARFGTQPLGAATRRAFGAPAGARARLRRGRPHASGHRRQSRRLHPVHALPAGLPGHPGQRRDRPGVPRSACADQLRHRRHSGQFQLRRLRRMRAGLSDRRADAGPRCRAGAR